MDIISTQESFGTPAAFVKACQQWERGGKRWGQYVGLIAGRDVAIKTYGRSYPQIVRVDGIDHGGLCDMKPTAFAALIERACSLKA